MRNKKADAGAIATFLMLMAVFILFYVLLIPPSERDILLGDEPSDSNGGFVGIDGGDLLLSAFPGRLSPIIDTELVREIGTISLFSKSGKDIIDLAGLFNLKSQFFDEDVKNLFFNIDSPQDLEEVNLIFFVNKAKGDLTIDINGFEIFDGEVRQESLPIRIPTNLIKKTNNLKFTIKSGFFSTEYELSDIKLSITQRLEKISALRTFSLTGGEKQGLERATLSYFVNCLSLKDQGTITLFLNDRLLFSDFASCDVSYQVIDLPLNRVRTGINNLEFRIDRGDYIIEDASVFFEISERDFPVYNFEVDDTDYRILFNRCYDECVFDCDVTCDSNFCLNQCIGECSDICNTRQAILSLRFRDEGRKVAAISVNEFQLNINTFSPLHEVDITGFIRRGSNSIKIVPKTEFEIETLQIFIG